MEVSIFERYFWMEEVISSEAHTCFYFYFLYFNKTKKMIEVLRGTSGNGGNGDKR